MPYCTKCGTEVSETAQFCPNCGASLRPSGFVSEPSIARRRGEKSEKQEKGEKHEKGEKGEGRAGPLTGGLVLIWLGITFFLASSNYISWASWWAYFLLGLGAILLVQAAIIFATNKQRGVVYGPAIGGAVLVAIGAASILSVTNWWWLILVVIGIAVIASALREKGQNPKP